MKALVYTGPGRIELRDVPALPLAEGETLVRVQYSGICGSDMHAFLGHDDRRPAPLIHGHEASGVVVDGVGFAATCTDACAAVRPGDVIVHIGLGQATCGLDVRQMTLQEIALIGTYTYTVRDFRDTAQAIFDDRLGALDRVETRRCKTARPPLTTFAAEIQPYPRSF